MAQDKKTDRKSLLTARDVAERLQVNPRTVHNWKDRGMLPYVRLSSRVIRFDTDVVDEFAESNSIGLQHEEPAHV
ncbi:helix-turn-helix domain-containing protein [Pirellulaceae bacterium SH467]